MTFSRSLLRCILLGGLVCGALPVAGQPSSISSEEMLQRFNDARLRLSLSQKPAVSGTTSTTLILTDSEGRLKDTKETYEFAFIRARDRFAFRFVRNEFSSPERQVPNIVNTQHVIMDGLALHRIVDQRHPLHQYSDSLAPTQVRMSIDYSGIAESLRFERTFHEESRDFLLDLDLDVRLPLGKALADGVPSLRPETVEIEGADTIVMDVRTQYGMYSFWLDAKLGYLPRRTEVVKVESDHFDGTPVNRSATFGGAPGDLIQFSVSLEGIEYGEIGGQIAIVKATSKQQYVHANGRTVTYNYTVERASFNLDPDLSSSGLFKIDIPDHTPVYNTALSGAAYEWLNGRVSMARPDDLIALIDQQVEEIGHSDAVTAGEPKELPASLRLGEPVTVSDRVRGNWRVIASVGFASLISIVVAWRLYRRGAARV